MQKGAEPPVMVGHQTRVHMLAHSLTSPLGQRVELALFSSLALLNRLIMHVAVIKGKEFVDLLSQCLREASAT